MHQCAYVSENIVIIVESLISSKSPWTSLIFMHILNHHNMIMVMALVMVMVMALAVIYPSDDPGFGSTKRPINFGKWPFLHLKLDIVYVGISSKCTSLSLFQNDAVFGLSKMFSYLHMHFCCSISFLALIPKYPKRKNTPPKFDIAPEKWWLEDDPFLLGFGNFSGASCWNFGGVSQQNPQKNTSVSVMAANKRSRNTWFSSGKLICVCRIFKANLLEEFASKNGFLITWFLEFWTSAKIARKIHCHRYRIHSPRLARGIARQQQQGETRVGLEANAAWTLPLLGGKAHGKLVFQNQNRKYYITMYHM